MRVYTTAHFGAIEAIKVIRSRNGHDLKTAKCLMEVLRSCKSTVSMDALESAKAVMDQFPLSGMSIILDAYDALMDEANELHGTRPERVIIS
jgi:hypothetical protein